MWKGFGSQLDSILTAIGQIRIAFLVQFDGQLILLLFEEIGRLLLHQFGLSQTLFRRQFPRLWLLLEIKQCDRVLDCCLRWNVEFLTASGAKCIFRFDDKSEVRRRRSFQCFSFRNWVTNELITLMFRLCQIEEEPFECPKRYRLPGFHQYWMTSHDPRTHDPRIYQSNELYGAKWIVSENVFELFCGFIFTFNTCSIVWRLPIDTFLQHMSQDATVILRTQIFWFPTEQLDLSNTKTTEIKWNFLHKR